MVAPKAGFGADGSGILVWAGPPYVEIEIEEDGTFSLFADDECLLEFSSHEAFLTDPIACSVLRSLPKK